MTALGTALVAWSPEAAAIVLTAIQPDGAITRAEISARRAFELGRELLQAASEKTRANGGAAE